MSKWRYIFDNHIVSGTSQFKLLYERIPVLEKWEIEYLKICSKLKKEFKIKSDAPGITFGYITGLSYGIYNPWLNKITINKVVPHDKTDTIAREFAHWIQVSLLNATYCDSMAVPFVVDPRKVYCDVTYINMLKHYHAELTARIGRFINCIIDEYPHFEEEISHFSTAFRKICRNQRSV